MVKKTNMTTENINNFLVHGDKSRIARKFHTSHHTVYDVAIGRLKGKFGKAKLIKEALLKKVEENINEGLVTK
jgi:hypothetical protein